MLHLAPQVANALVQAYQAAQASKSHHEVAYQVIRMAMKLRRLDKL